MGYKHMDRNMTFLEVDFTTSMEHSRSLKMMEKINQIIDWSKIEAVLLKHYTVGTTIEGADSYTPLMLLKAFLLQKWFRIMRKETKSAKLTESVGKLLTSVQNFWKNPGIKKKFNQILQDSKVS